MALASTRLKLSEPGQTTGLNAGSINTGTEKNAELALTCLWHDFPVSSFRHFGDGNRILATTARRQAMLHTRNTWVFMDVTPVNEVSKPDR
jgi:hypothetical protein